MSYKNWKIIKSELNPVWTDEEIKHLKDMEETKNIISNNDYKNEEDYLDAINTINREIEEYTKELNTKYDELAKKNLNEYSTVAKWCNESGLYAIQEINDEYCVVKIPEPTFEEQNETIRQTRQALFTQYADPLKYDYEECLARYGENDERTVEAKNIWLVKKDEIREQNQYL